MSAVMAYQFRRGTRVPEGVTAAGVLSERDLIEERRGEATIDASAAEVLRAPADYPNLHAFCPASAEEALLQATKESIRKAFQAVIYERVAGTNERGEPRVVEIRQLHAVPGSGAERAYKSLEIIRQSDKDLRALVRDLRVEASSYQGKMISILAEVEDALGG